MKATKEDIEMLRELFPFIAVINENHRLGVEIEILQEELKYQPRKFNYEWIYAGKHRPSLFKTFFTGFDKNFNAIIDNYCNIVEEEDFNYDRGECELRISDKKVIVEIYDL